jgi:hypothetical protein
MSTRYPGLLRYVTEASKLDLITSKEFCYVYAEHHLNVQGSACMNQVLSNAGENKVRIWFRLKPLFAFGYLLPCTPWEILASRPDRQTNNCNTILTELVLVPLVRGDNQTDGTVYYMIGHARHFHPGLT